MQGMCLIMFAFFAILWIVGERQYRQTAAIICIASGVNFVIWRIYPENSDFTALIYVVYDAAVIWLLKRFGSMGRTRQGVILGLAMCVNAALCIDLRIVTDVIYAQYQPIIVALSALQMVASIDGFWKSTMDPFTRIALDGSFAAQLRQRCIQYRAYVDRRMSSARQRGKT